MISFYTVACNRPDFVHLQWAAFRKHMREPYQFTVVNNADLSGLGGVRDTEGHKRIADKCASLGIPVIDVQHDVSQEPRRGEKIFNANGTYYNANVAAAYPWCWAWENFISKDTHPVCILHSDMFLFDTFDASYYLEQTPICFIAQGRPGGIEYMWDALALLDLPRLPEVDKIDWWCGKINGTAVDVGGQTHNYLAAHPEIPKLLIQPNYTEFDDASGFRPADYETERFDGVEKFVHYRTGSNWNARTNEYHAAKSAWLWNKLNLGQIL